MKGDWLIVR